MVLPLRESTKKPSYESTPWAVLNTCRARLFATARIFRKIMAAYLNLCPIIISIIINFLIFIIAIIINNYFGWTTKQMHLISWPVANPWWFNSCFAFVLCGVVSSLKTWLKNSFNSVVWRGEGWDCFPSLACKKANEKKCNLKVNIHLPCLIQQL